MTVMEAQHIAAWVQAGGLCALATIMTVLHVWTVRYVLPEQQRLFHEELARERSFWREELGTVRENTERRQREVIAAMNRMADRIEKALRGRRYGREVEDGGDPDTEA